MPIPEQFVDELVARSEITEVISSYVHLTRKGNNLWGLCPFHNEKTPSFSVSPDKQIYHCFGCGKGGGVISFVMEMENLPFPDAVRLLAQRVGLEVPDTGQSEGERRRRARLLEANKQAARFYHSCLKAPEGEAVRDYLAQRRILPRTATRFGLGAAPGGQWDALTRALTGQGFSKAELVEAGLAVAGKNGGVYDKFRARLMLPVIDLRGDVVGFTSRILPGEEGAKYLNSPDTPVFKKGRLVYALNFARATKRPNLVLVEGNIDVITLHQAGFDNAVATMGTALTEEHARLLARYTHELVLCYDNDLAGKQSTDRVLQILKKADLKVRVLQLPNGVDEQGRPAKQDPDDFIKRCGPAAFEKCLSGSVEPGEYRLTTLRGAHNLEEEEGRRAYLQEAVAAAAAIASPIERELFCNKAAAAAGISPQAMGQEVEQYRRGRIRAEQKRQERRELTPAVELQPRQHGIRYDNLRSARAEEGVVRLLMLDPSLAPQAAVLREEEFSSPLLGKVFSLLQRRYQQGLGTQLGTQLGVLAESLSQQEMSHMTQVLDRPQSLSNSRQAMEDYITIIRTQAAKGDGLTDEAFRAVREQKNRNTER